MGSSDSAAVRVTLWRLPDGQRQEATTHGPNGRTLEVELASAESASELAPGALVEIEDPERVYLGEVEDRRGNRLRIVVEHFLEQREIARIREIWR